MKRMGRIEQGEGGQRTGECDGENKEKEEKDRTGQGRAKGGDG